MAQADSGNIFLTWENLAFAMPLLLTIAVYWFFKLFPLPVAMGIMFAGFIVYQIRMQMKAQRNKKLEQMDDKTIQELIEEEEKSDFSSQAAKQQEKKKAMNKVQARLAQERKQEAKKANNKGKSKAVDNEDEDADLSTFANKKKK